MKQKKNYFLLIVLALFLGFLQFQVMNQSNQIRIKMGTLWTFLQYMKNTASHKVIFKFQSDDDPSESEIDNALEMINQFSNYDIGIASYIENENVTLWGMQSAKDAIMNIFIPWIIVGVITLFVFGFIISCFFDKYQKNNSTRFKVGKCKIKKPKKLREMRVSLACSLLFNAAIVGISIYCLIVSNNKPYKNMPCLASEIVYQASEGTKNWIGFPSYIDDLYTIYDSFNYIYNDTKQLAKKITIQVENITNNYDELLAQNEELGNSYQQDSFYQQNLILAYISNGTDITNDDIAKEADDLSLSSQAKLFNAFYKNISESILNMKQYSLTLINNHDALNQTMQIAIINSNLMSQGAERSNQKLQAFIQDWENTFTPFLYKLNLGYFAGFIVFSGFILCASCCICCDKCICCAKVCYQITWFLYFFSAIGAFGMCGLMQTQMAILAEGYDHFKDINTNQTKFNQINRLLPDVNFKTFLRKCIFNGGDVASIVGLDSLSDISNLYDMVYEFQTTSYEFKALSLKINESLLMNWDFMNEFNNFTRIDEEEPNSTNSSESVNVKYLMRTSVKECNYNQNSSVPDNMTYCEKDAYKFDPAVDLLKNFTPESNQSICFQSATFFTNRSLISEYIPHCSYLSIIDNKYANQTQMWQNASAQELIILEMYKNISDPLMEYVDMINNYTSDHYNSFLNFGDSVTGLAVIQNQQCDILNTTIDKVKLGFYKLIAYYRMVWILNLSISLLLFFNQIWMFRVIMNIYYIQRIEPYQVVFEGQEKLPF